MQQRVREQTRRYEQPQERGVDLLYMQSQAKEHFVDHEVEYAQFSRYMESLLALLEAFGVDRLEHVTPEVIEEKEKTVEDFLYGVALYKKIVQIWNTFEIPVEDCGVEINRDNIEHKKVIDGKIYHIEKKAGKVYLYKDGQMVGDRDGYESYGQLMKVGSRACCFLFKNNRYFPFDFDRGVFGNPEGYLLYFSLHAVGGNCYAGVRGDDRRDFVIDEHGQSLTPFGFDSVSCVAEMEEETVWLGTLDESQSEPAKQKVVFSTKGILGDPAGYRNITIKKEKILCIQGEKEDGTRAIIGSQGELFQSQLGSHFRKEIRVSSQHIYLKTVPTNDHCVLVRDDGVEIPLEMQDSIDAIHEVAGETYVIVRRNNRHHILTKEGVVGEPQGYVGVDGFGEQNGKVFFAAVLGIRWSLFYDFKPFGPSKDVYKSVQKSPRVCGGEIYVNAHNGAFENVLITKEKEIGKGERFMSIEVIGGEEDVPIFVAKKNGVWEILKKDGTRWGVTSRYKGFVEKPRCLMVGGEWVVLAVLDRKRIVLTETGIMGREEGYHGVIWVYDFEGVPVVSVRDCDEEGKFVFQLVNEDGNSLTKSYSSIIEAGAEERGYFYVVGHRDAKLVKDIYPIEP